MRKANEYLRKYKKYRRKCPKYRNRHSHACRMRKSYWRKWIHARRH